MDAAKCPFFEDFQRLAVLHLGFLETTDATVITGQRTETGSHVGMALIMIVQPDLKRFLV